jgi:hypothetical protein
VSDQKKLALTKKNWQGQKKLFGQFFLVIRGTLQHKAGAKQFASWSCICILSIKEVQEYAYIEDKNTPIEP